INRDLVSIERSDGGDITTPISPRQFESICQLTAHWFDQAHVPWDRYPVNPNHGSGIVTHMLHREFATKGCPWAAVADQIDAIQARVRAILKAAQTSDAHDPTIPSPAPITPDHDWWPQGYDLATLSARFGKLTRHDLSGATRLFGFDPAGAISNAWVARAATEHLAATKLPRARDWWQHPGASGTLNIITFDHGWVLVRTGEDRAWRWTA
ncbi:MAG TPA: hypothetical protein PK691_06185, partial [Thermomicrobiales bacterium]|nr:hypothetical protein [Thermomicrobiales bacterium]